MTVGYQESCLRLKLKATVFEELVTFTDIPTQRPISLKGEKH